MDPGDGTGGASTEEGRWMGEDEERRVRLLRAAVEREDPAAKGADDATLRRFLRARDQSIDKSSSMFLKYLEWRRAEVPNGFISEAEIENELSQKKLFSQGFDRKGHPIGVILGGKHLYSKRDLDEFRRCVVYGLDKLCSRMPCGKEKFTFIADVEGWRFANCDIRAYLASLEIMQNYYPERLNKVFLVHVPYIFMKAWKIIYPIIDKNTKKKDFAVYFCGRQESERSTVEGHRRESASREIWRKTPISPCRQQLKPQSQGVVIVSCN